MDGTDPRTAHAIDNLNRLADRYAHGEWTHEDWNAAGELADEVSGRTNQPAHYVLAIALSDAIDRLIPEGTYCSNGHPPYTDRYCGPCLDEEVALR
jgi:hypothetical protein